MVKYILLNYVYSHALTLVYDYITIIYIPLHLQISYLIASPSYESY